MVLELNKKLALLEDSKTEIQNGLGIENRKLTNIQQKHRDIKENGEKNPLDFNDIDQQDDDIIQNKFLDLAENIRTKFLTTPIFDLILDSRRDKYPFMLNGDFIFNDVNLFKLIDFTKTQIS